MKKTVKLSDLITDFHQFLINFEEDKTSNHIAKYQKWFFKEEDQTKMDKSRVLIGVYSIPSEITK